MIELINVSKTFDTKTGTIHALKDINLSIDKGDIYGIIGFSGAGKSTLVRCINFLEVPTKGVVKIDSTELHTLTPVRLREKRKNIGMIFQHFNLMYNIDVFDNIAAPLRRQGYSKDEIDKKVHSLLKLVGLEDKIHSYPRQLSGGQKQRVAIARALSNDPQILLCDEATSALDPNTTKSILQLLREIHRTTGITVVIITHQMEVVKQICTKVAVMENGVIVEKGSLFEIFSSPKSAIAQDFVSQTMHTQEFLDKMKDENRTLYKISFLGETTHHPLIAEVIKNYDVLINILFGNIEKISDSFIGSLYVEILGEDKKITEAIDFMQSKGTRIEVVSHA